MWFGFVHVWDDWAKIIGSWFYMQDSNLGFVLTSVVSGSDLFQWYYCVLIWHIWSFSVSRFRFLCIASSRLRMSYSILYVSLLNLDLLDFFHVFARLIYTKCCDVNHISLEQFTILLGIIYHLCRIRMLKEYCKCWRGSNKVKYEVRVVLIMIILFHFTSSLVILFRPGFRSSAINSNVIVFVLEYRQFWSAHRWPYSLRTTPSLGLLIVDHGGCFESREAERRQPVHSALLSFTVIINKEMNQLFLGSLANFYASSVLCRIFYFGLGY